jgi:hypothetical protein
MIDLADLAGASPSLPLMSLVGNWRLGSLLRYRSRREIGNASQGTMGLKCKKFTGKCC